MIKDVTWKDGTWHQTDHSYKNHKILIKSRSMHGIKAIIFLPNSEEVRKVIRYRFCSPLDLLVEAEKEIDKF